MSADSKQKAKRIVKKCLNCKKQFSVPPCRDWREHCCSSECKAAYRKMQSEQLAQERTRTCAMCGSSFVVKASQIKGGHGKFCSQACKGKSMVGTTTSKEAAEKRLASWKRGVEEGRITFQKGEQNSRWKGGKKAYVQRSIKSGAAKEQLRAYRKANPDKVREWSSKRSGRKTGRLPRGTISDLYSLQKGLCAICGVQLDGRYHKDHIVPLARGGLHVRSNIQLTCPSCNLRKSDKDPIAFMQEMGRLL